MDYESCMKNLLYPYSHIWHCNVHSDDNINGIAVLIQLVSVVYANQEHSFLYFILIHVQLKINTVQHFALLLEQTLEM